MKKLLYSIIAFWLSFGLVQPIFAAEAWQIDQFTSNITLQTDGSVTIKETIGVTFNEAKHGIYRDIPYVYESNGQRVGSEVTVNKVSQDEDRATYEIDKNQANLRIRIGDADKTITGQHVYTIDYTVKGVLRSYGSYDELYWNVTGNDWSVPIGSASATVSLPSPSLIQAACYRGALGSTETCEAQKLSETVEQFTATNLEPGEGMTIAAGYTPGLVPIITVAPPLTLLEAILSPISLTSFGLVTILGLLLLARNWLKQGRDEWYGNKALPQETAATIPFFTRETISPEFESPNNLRPAELGVLVDERADTLDITATIVDLASRGYLTIEEVPKSGLFGKSDYRLVKKKAADKALNSYESLLFSSLFSDLFSKRETVLVSELQNLFYSDLAKIKDALYSQMTTQGYFQANPQKVRAKYLEVGLFGLIAGVGLGFFGGASLIPLLIGLGVGVALVGTVAMVFSFAMPARTAKGRYLYRQALGYKLFIDTAEKYRARFEENENLFTATLPYAIVFGSTKKFAEAMKKIGIKPSQPTWYTGTHPWNPVVFASDVDNLSTSLSSAMASTPSSSGSGGGGSSGGGFGGGGGGSW